MDWGKPVFIKTYGTKSRRVAPWISPDNRKQIFESSRSVGSEPSVCEVSTPAVGSEPSVCGPSRPTKNREETTKRKGTRAAKRKAKMCPKEKENLGDHSFADDSPVEQRGKRSGVGIPSAGRFVTRRRPRNFPPPPSEASRIVLNSSDDFVARRGILRPPRRQIPCEFQLSTAETSQPEAGTQSSVGDLHKSEGGSLVEAAVRSLGPYPRKPLFCSTPSVSLWLGSLVDVLKRACLTVPSTITLKRVDSLIPGLQHTSCLPQTPSPMGSAEDGYLVDSPRSEETLDPSLSLFSTDGTCKDLPLCFQPNVSTHGTPTAGLPQQPGAAYSSTDGASAVRDSTIMSVGHTTRQEDSIDPSVILVDSSHHLDDEDDCGGGGACASSTQSLEDSPPVDKAAFTDSGSAEWVLELRATLKEECLLRKCRVPLQRLAWPQQPVTAPFRTEVSSSGSRGRETVEHEATASKSNTAIKTDPLKHKHLRRSTARSTTAILSRSSPDRAGGDDGAPEPAAVPMPKEASLAKTPHVLVHRWTPDIGRCLGKGLAPESLEPAHHADQRDGPRRLSKRTAHGLKDAGAADPPDNPTKRQKLSAAPREQEEKKKKREKKGKKGRERSMSKDRSGTARKACISGLSVSRWKDQSSTSARLFHHSAQTRGASRAGDCSITELLSAQHKPSKVLSESLLRGSGVLFSTPPRALNMSSLLAHLTPDTHTWSRLKAALSSLLRPRPLGSSSRAPFGDLSQDLFATPTQTPRHGSTLLHSTSLVTLQSACEDQLSDGGKVYAECGQRGPLSWEECLLPHRLKRCVKIGEGTFGEVFSTTNASEETVALKIIPVEGSETVNGEEQKTFGEILHEIIISKELSSLKIKSHNRTHGFIGLNDLHCVQGCYPAAMLDAWDAFDKRKGSENDRPDFFGEQQLFLILEFEFGGTDLENSNGTLPSLVVAKSILHQVTAALAVAEQELCFEHRDLHWGNVLVKSTKEKTGTFLLNGTNHSLATRGVLVRIIDYSLSRLEIDGLTVSCDISTDEELFMGQGDYQFDIYRLMRQQNGNDWSVYRPRSNILWLHYLSDKLRSMKYRAAGGRGTKGVREELARFHDNLLQYSSATEALQNCPLFQ
ncbi:hypothetical protein CRUP_019229 [Coryphaenoides rupestris]|nr:hypothetical protein CRUP_019229 [Coryphaenoides rupestris]